ncbi:hypothetical protein HK104_007909, partial [Borealophlyctis nickersoniae]
QEPRVEPPAETPPAPAIGDSPRIRPKPPKPGVEGQTGPLVYPVIVVLEAIRGNEEPGSSPSPSPFNSQSTFATLIAGPDGHYDIKVLKQKAMMDGVSYLLQEIYGFTDPSAQDTVGFGGETARKCYATKDNNLPETFPRDGRDHLDVLYADK